MLSNTLLVVDPDGANVSILSTDSFIEEVQSLLNRLALRVTDRQTDMQTFQPLSELLSSLNSA